MVVWIRSQGGLFSVGHSQFDLAKFHILVAQQKKFGKRVKGACNVN
jgi:hypothetical protein